MNENSIRYTIQKTHRTFSSDQRVASQDSRGASRYTIEFPNHIHNVVSVSVKDCYIPRSEYIIDSHNDTIDYEAIQWYDTNSYVTKSINSIVIEKGNYTISELIEYLNTTTNNNIIFSIPDSKTNRVHIEIKQESYDFNGLRFLFGTGPNAHRSASRILGFESGVDTPFTTRPIYFSGILSSDSNIITTSNSQLKAGFIVEECNNLYPTDLGVIETVSGGSISETTLKLSLQEYTTLYTLLQQEKKYNLHIGLNKHVNPDIYKNASFHKYGMILNDNSLTYLFSNYETLNTDTLVVKYNTDVYISDVHDVSDNIATLDNNNFINPTRFMNSLSGKFIQNSTHSVDIHINYAYYDSNSTSYLFSQIPTMNKFDYIQYTIKSEKKIDTKTPDDVDLIKYKHSSPLYVPIVNFTFPPEGHITHKVYSYNGNIKENISVSTGDNSQILSYIRIVSHSQFTNSMGISFITNSVSIINSYTDAINSFTFKMNCPNDGDIAFQFNPSSSFYWSSSSDMSNSYFISSQSHGYVYYNSQIDVVYTLLDQFNSFSISYPSSFDIDGVEYSISNYTEQSYFWKLWELSETIVFVDADYNEAINIDSEPSSEVYFQSISTIYYPDTNCITLYVVQSPESHSYTYTLFNSINSELYSSITSNSFFCINMNDKNYETYTVKLSGEYTTQDTFTFSYINNTFTINCHYYDHTTNTYFINSFSKPDGLSSIEIVYNNSTYYNSVALGNFGSVYSSHSAHFQINNQTFEFTSCLRDSIDITHDTRLEYKNNRLQTRTLICTPNSGHIDNMTHFQITTVIDSHSKLNSIQINSTFEFQFPETFIGQSIQLIFQGVDENDTPIGSSITWSGTNDDVYHMIPNIQTKSFNYYDNSVLYNSGYISGYDKEIVEYIKEQTEFPCEIQWYGIDYTIDRKFDGFNSMKVYINNNSYSFEFVTYNSFHNDFELLKVNGIIPGIISKYTSWKNIQFQSDENNNYIDGYVSQDIDSIICNLNDLNEYHSYLGHILTLQIRQIDTVIHTFYILNKPHKKPYYKASIIDNAVLSVPVRNFLYFKNKEMLSPYAYDIERTPIVQIVCERLGNLQVYSPIGFYNFKDSITTGTSIQLPGLSRVNKIELSLKRRNSTLDKQNDENIYYEWNGMEHTIILEFEHKVVL